jgi:ribose-phosphate pyrophosphokinase
MLAGAFNRIITVDPHLHRTPRLADVFPGIESDNLRGADAIAHGLRLDNLPSNTLVVGPDIEASQWADAIAAQTGLEAAVFVKTRHSDRAVSLDLPVGLSVAGRPIVLADDICSSGGTLRAALVKLREERAAKTEIVVTHALFDAAAERSFQALGATRIRSTDSCTHPTNAFALAPMLAAALEKEIMQ